MSASLLWQICGILDVDANLVLVGLPHRVWRSRAEYEAFREEATGALHLSPPGVGEAQAHFAPPPTPRQILSLAKAAEALDADQIDMLVSMARNLKR